MSFTLTLYNLKKKKNSTLRPTNATLAATYQCVLKDNTSILAPTFIVQTDANLNNMLSQGRYIMANYDSGDNYYYWLADMRSVCYGVWEIDGKLDVLATWKTEIGDLSAYIVRWSGATNAIGLVDEYMQLSTYHSLRRNDYDMSLSIGLLGYYVVALNGSTSGDINRYGNELIAFATVANLESFLLELYGLNGNAGIKNTIASIMGDGTGLQNIISGIYYIPIANPSALQLTYNLTIFGYTFSQTCRGITSNGIGGTVNLSFYSSSYNVLKFEPYANYSIYLPYAGEINIPSSVALNSCYVKYNLDCKTGDITYTIGYSGGIYRTITTCIAIQCKFDLVTDNISADTVRFWTTGINAALNRNVGGVFETLTHLQDNQTHSFNGGNQRLFEIVDGEKKIIAYTSAVNLLNNPPDYKPLFGYPYCQVGLIKEHTGYVKCLNASIYGTGIDVRDEINSYLNGGFFYE